MVKDQQILLYTDTSVISDIDADSERGEMTREFFRIVAESPDEYQLVISPVTTGELKDAPTSKQAKMSSFLADTKYLLLPEMAEAKQLASRYTDEEVLTETHFNDLLHIAYATVARCDYVISWNMRHMVNVRTISRVSMVNAASHYVNVVIVTPASITKENTHAND